MFCLGIKNGNVLSGLAVPTISDVGRLQQSPDRSARVGNKLFSTSVERVDTWPGTLELIRFIVVISISVANNYRQGRRV